MYGHSWVLCHAWNESPMGDARLKKQNFPVFSSKIHILPNFVSLPINSCFQNPSHQKRPGIKSQIPIPLRTLWRVRLGFLSQALSQAIRRQDFEARVIEPKQSLAKGGYGGRLLVKTRVRGQQKDKEMDTTTGMKEEFYCKMNVLMKMHFAQKKSTLVGPITFFQKNIARRRDKNH